MPQGSSTIHIFTLLLATMAACLMATETSEYEAQLQRQLSLVQALRSERWPDGVPSIAASITAMADDDRRMAFTALQEVLETTAEPVRRRQLVDLLVCGLSDTCQEIRTRTAIALRDSRAVDFTNDSRAAIARAASQSLTPSLMLVVGAAELRDFLPKMTMVAARPISTIENGRDQSTWNALFVLARWGDKDAFEKIVEAIEANASGYDRWFFDLPALSYIRNDLAIEYFNRLVFDEAIIIDSWAKDLSKIYPKGIPVASLGANGLSHLVRGFPSGNPVPGSDPSVTYYTPELIAECRKWLNSHSPVHADL